MVVDICWNNGMAGGDFLSNEFRGNIFRQVGTKALAWMLLI
ncbi:MAG: hypothetical protein AB8W78_10295 [Arsenophonus endosymbiont of Dermacentor nuttalli]